jgi:hypothetical protein
VKAGRHDEVTGGRFDVDALAESAARSPAVAELVPPLTTGDHDSTSSQVNGVGTPHAYPPSRTRDHASCDHTATTDGVRSVPSAAPNDSRPHRAQEVLPVVVMEEIERLRWALSQIIALADEAPGLTDEQLRERLLTLATQARW